MYRPNNYHHKPRVRINRYITAPQVRLIDMHGTMLGVKPLAEAVSMARGANLDLVEISPQAQPPVCKVMDYNKYLYEKEKQERENKKKQKAGQVKEIRFKPRIASHDLETKVKHMAEFLKAHNKVRITVMFRGRENQHRDIGAEILESIRQNLSEVGTLEGKPQLIGNRMSIMLSPLAGKPQAKPPKPQQPPAPKQDGAPGA